MYNKKNFDRENYFDINWDETLEVNLNDTNKSTERFILRFNTLLDKYMPLKRYVNCKNLARKNELKVEYKLSKNEITTLQGKKKKDHYKN